MMPRLLLLVLFGAAGLPFAVAPFLPAAGTVGVFLTVLVLVAALVDLAISPSLARIEVRRDAKDVQSLAARNAVRLWFVNRNRRPVLVEAHDETPQPGTVYDLPFEIALQPNRRQYSVYHVEPHHRGKYRFGTVFLRSRSRLRLWTLQDERPLPQPVRVFPNIQAVHGMELLARKNRIAQAGVQLSRLRGRGTEFDRLREYRREDEFRSIDWKATARHQDIISREYVVERNQSVLLVLDSGRSMCNELDGLTHFDRALNAAILLSYVALRQGDSVGVMACSNQVDAWIPPLRGPRAIQSLIGRVYDLEPRYEATDYALMVEQIRRRHRKRSLVVLLTHALDELHLDAISRHARQLRSPHLVVAAFLRNVPLHERVNTVPRTDLEAFQVAAAAEMAASQTAQIAELQQSGLLIIDTLPEQLTANLITRYLDIKARHLL